MRDRRKIRCAIYTRKSSEEGLEQDFNSLDAQREACEAYVSSQKHEGWTLLPGPYDDGGFSGGSMERPGLQKLLADIASGQIDIVVVYKVDRLTRSLMDFARIVEVFDRRGVSFVSVTQAFNTTTSMGRLTLNVLLSFAQFEREVTGERIRDKIAASKKKGLWMGGWVPLGYRANGRTLAINEAEAETVRTIYASYLNLKSVDALKQELDRKDVRTAPRHKGKKASSGLPFSRGHLYRILSNPLYIGQIRHRRQVYEGQHPGIIDQTTWDAVQAVLAANSHRQLVKAHSKNPSLLAGLLVDGAGEKLVATHARNNGKRYRYYVSGAAQRHRRIDALEGRGSRSDQRQKPPWRLPACEVETLVVRAIGSALRNKSWLLDHVILPGDTVGQHQASFQRAHDLARQLEGADAIARRGLMLALVDGIVLGTGSLAIRLRGCAITSGLVAEVEPSAPTDKKFALITQPVAVRRRGAETKLIVEGEEQPDPEPDPALLKAVAQAHRWWGDLLNQRFSTMRDLAHAYGTDERYVARIIPMAFLPSKLSRDILDGTQPVEVTLHQLLHA